MLYFCTLKALEIRLLQPELLSHKALAPIRSLTDIIPHVSGGGGLSLTVAGFGGGVDLQKAAGADLPATVPMALLEEHFLALVQFLKATPINGYRYSGLIVHVNNFDILLAQPKQKRAVSGFFNEIRDILGQSSERLAGTVGREEAQALLARERWDRLQHAVGLTAEQLKIVRHFAASAVPLSQKDIAETFGIAQPNVSGYYFKPLKEAGVIEEQEGTGKPTYWQLSWEYRPLRWTGKLVAEAGEDVW